MAAVPQCGVLNARAPCLTADKHMLFLSRRIYGVTHNSISATSTIQGYKEVFYDAVIQVNQTGWLLEQCSTLANAGAGVSAMTAKPFSRTKL